MGNKLYVGNLPYSVRDGDLEQAFGQFGAVTSAKVMMERDTGRSKGFGFVEMGSDAEAQAAINGMNGQPLPCVAEGAARPERHGVLLEDEVQRVLFGFDTPPRLRTLVTARWRLTVYANATWGELYDLQDDPHELVNLWEDAGHRAIRGELIEQVEAVGSSVPYHSDTGWGR